MAAGDTKVFVIANAHIDPVWIWDWREGMREVVATFQAAADRLDEDEDLYFAASSACYYDWVERLAPELFSRIRRHVSSGRWEVVGGEWVEPDCNVPSGESVCRQLLYSQRYFWETFGHAAKVAYNVDSFGHAGSLPQLFRKAGLDSYVMMRPQEHERSIPGPLFRWEGVDGTEILTFRIETAYQTGLPTRDGTEARLDEEQQLISRRVGKMFELAAKQQLPMMFFFGVGDHGGGPTKSGIAQLRKIASENEGELSFASPVQYFRKVAASCERESLPKVRGDLHMHAVGCYSVVSWVKRENAIAEQALGTAETMASLCSLLSGANVDPGGRVREAWLRVLFNQFHDSLGGTCTEEAFDDLQQFYGYARTVADEVTAEATEVVAGNVDTFIEGANDTDRLQSANPFSGHFPVPVVVFNPLSWAVRAPLVLPHPATGVTAEGQKAVAVQNVVSREGTRYPAKAAIVAEVPAFGYRVFFLHNSSAPVLDSASLVPTGPGKTGSGHRIESQHYVVTADRGSGGITSVISKRSGREWVLVEGLRPVVVEDPSDTWSHGVVGYSDAEQSCALEEVKVLESGPVRSRLRLSYRWGESLIWLDAVLYGELEHIDIVLQADWRQRHQLLKLVLPLAVESPRLRVGIPYGAIEREADGQEEVMAHWLDLFDEVSGAGVICSSDSGYGYDALGSRLRLTVLRSPRYADHGAPWTGVDPIDWPATGQGRHSVSYRLRAHNERASGGDGLRLSAEHITRLPIVSETWHRGALGASGSAMAVEPSNVVASVLKRAEDGSGWVVRLSEVAGEAVEARISIDRLGRSWEGDLRAYEVTTLLVPDDPAVQVREVAISELELG